MMTTQESLEQIRAELTELEEWLENNVTVKTHREIMERVEQVRELLKELEKGT